MNNIINLILLSRVSFVSIIFLSTQTYNVNTYNPYYWGGYLHFSCTFMSISFIIYFLSFYVWLFFKIIIMFQIIVNPKKNEDFSLGNLMSKNIALVTKWEWIFPLEPHNLNARKLSLFFISP